MGLIINEMTKYQNHRIIGCKRFQKFSSFTLCPGQESSNHLDKCLPNRQSEFMQSIHSHIIIYFVLQFYSNSHGAASNRLSHFFILQKDKQQLSSPVSLCCPSSYCHLHQLTDISLTFLLFCISSKNYFVFVVVVGIHCQTFEFF